MGMRLHTVESSRQCPAVSKEISDTVVLINNGLAVRCLRNIYVYSLVLLSALVREVSFCSGQQSLQTPDWASVATQPQGSGNIVGAGTERMKEPEDEEECHKMEPSGSDTALHYRAHGSCDRLHKTGPVNIPSRMGKGFMILHRWLRIFWQLMAVERAGVPFLR